MNPFIYGLACIGAICLFGIVLTILAVLAHWGCSVARVPRDKCPHCEEPRIWEDEE